MLDPILKEQYNIIEDAENLSEVDDIEYYFSECYDDFDCGQGYYEDNITHIAYIDSKYYMVIITANIASAKQDRGDRLYWVEDISHVTFTEIDKPEYKNAELTYLYFREFELNNAMRVLKDADIKYFLTKEGDE